MGLWGRPRVCGRASSGHALWGFCGGPRAVAGRGRSWALAPSSGSLAHRLGGGSEALRGGGGSATGVYHLGGSSVPLSQSPRVDLSILHTTLQKQDS